MYIIWHRYIDSSLCMSLKQAKPASFLLSASLRVNHSVDLRTAELLMFAMTLPVLRKNYRLLPSCPWDHNAVRRARASQPLPFLIISSVQLLQQDQELARLDYQRKRCDKTLPGCRIFVFARTSQILDPPCRSTQIPFTLALSPSERLVMISHLLFTHGRRSTARRPTVTSRFWFTKGRSVARR